MRRVKRLLAWCFFVEARIAACKAGFWTLLWKSHRAARSAMLINHLLVIGPKWATVHPVRPVVPAGGHNG